MPVCLLDWYAALLSAFLADVVESEWNVDAAGFELLDDPDEKLRGAVVAGLLDGVDGRDDGVDGREDGVLDREDPDEKLREPPDDGDEEREPDEDGGAAVAVVARISRMQRICFIIVSWTL